MTLNTDATEIYDCHAKHVNTVTLFSAPSTRVRQRNSCSLKQLQVAYFLLSINFQYEMATRKQMLKSTCVCNQ
jgi:hypothetical protein